MIIGAFDPGSKDNVGFACFDDNGYLWSIQGNAMHVFKEVWSAYKGVGGILFVCEDIFVGKSPKGSITLAKSSGEIRGFMRVTGLMTGDWWWEPSSRSWRVKLGFKTRLPDPTPEKPSRTRAAKADDYMEMSCEKARELTGMSFGEKREHEADAVCIAYAGWLRWQQLQNGSRQQSLLTT